jgi:hypothetical protein
MFMSFVSKQVLEIGSNPNIADKSGIVIRLEGVNGIGNKPVDLLIDMDSNQAKQIIQGLTEALNDLERKLSIINRQQ